MSDRELLELAAKAAGIEIQGEFSTVDRMYIHDGDWWNPLTDDGDALRLAVKLNMNVFQAAFSAYALPSNDDGTYDQQVRYRDVDGDPYAATRRAIVRAAAEIGRTL